jgi:hypothetical protein
MKAIAQINTWSRIAIAFRVEPGTYERMVQASA